jgi:EmrB/QacA subfamily drug resistance transporter
MAETKKTNHWFILTLLATAQFMVVLDTSIVNVMLPRVQTAFALSPTSLQWIITAYTLAFGGFLLLGGRAADLFGRRRVFLTGVACFATVSLLDGLSRSGGMLISLRALQGLSAAFMSPAALSIVLVTYKEGHERNIALSVWGAVASSGAAVGLLLGGILTQYLGWRWNFFINVPIGIFVFATAFRIVPKHEAEEGDNNLDLPGAAMVTAGLMLLVYGLVKAPLAGWTSHSALTYFIIAAALLVGFVINESKVKHPLIPLSVFKIRNVTGANFIQLATGASLFSVFYFTSLYIQDILGYSPVKTGLSFLPVPLVIAVGATIAPRLVKRIGYKPLLIVAPLVTGLGLFMLGHIPVQGSYLTHVLPGLMVMGAGLGFTFVSLLIAATTGIAGHLSGLASGLVNTSQQLGGSLGLAILTGIAASTTAAFYKLHNSSTSFAHKAATVHGYQHGFYIASCFAIAASLVAVFVIKQKKIPAGAKPVPAPAV